MDRMLLALKTRFSVGMLLALGMLLSPAAALATPATFTVSPTSFVGVTAAGSLVGTAGYAPGTTLAFDINYGVGGSAKPFTLTGFFLPSVSGGGVTYSFTGLPSVINGVIDVVSGALSTDPISGSVVRTPSVGSPSTPVPFGSPAFFLTTGNIPAGNCGGPYDSFNGTPVSVLGQRLDPRHHLRRREPEPRWSLAGPSQARRHVRAESGSGARHRRDARRRPRGHRLDGPAPEKRVKTTRQKPAGAALLPAFLFLALAMQPAARPGRRVPTLRLRSQGPADGGRVANPSRRR